MVAFHNVTGLAFESSAFLAPEGEHPLRALGETLRYSTAGFREHLLRHFTAGNHRASARHGFQHGFVERRFARMEEEECTPQQRNKLFLRARLNVQTIGNTKGTGMRHKRLQRSLIRRCPRAADDAQPICRRERSHTIENVIEALRRSDTPNRNEKVRIALPARRETHRINPLPGNNRAGRPQRNPV